MTTNKPAPNSKMIRPNVATYQIVSRNRSRTSRWISSRDEIASVAKAISGAAHGLNQLDGVLVVDLPAQAAHEHLEHVRERIMIFVPDVRGDCGAVDDLPRMKDKKLEERKFFRGELDWLAGTPHPLRFEIDLEIGNPYCLWKQRAA